LTDKLTKTFKISQNDTIRQIRFIVVPQQFFKLYKTIQYVCVNPRNEKVACSSHVTSSKKRDKINIISIALDAPQNTISALSGKVGNLSGISVKTAYSSVIGNE